MAVYVAAGLAHGDAVNEPPTPLAVALPFLVLGLSVGYTVWLGDGVDRVRERLTGRSADRQPVIRAARLAVSMS